MVTQTLHTSEEVLHFYYRLEKKLLTGGKVISSKRKYDEFFSVFV